MALYLQQAAFVGHDCGHNSVTFSSAFDGMLGFIAGPLLTGVSISWWKHCTMSTTWRPTIRLPCPDLSCPTLCPVLHFV